MSRDPRITSSNGKAIQEYFQDAPSAAVDISKIIDDYNNHMNGVDMSDQYRSYYSTQLPVCRTWMPLFFWILDTTIINAYLIHQHKEERSHTRSFESK
ncbi:hypothetical protein KI688_001190 [Linnemannia hyalina]|uniref:PiggyBac transposable element-derived protein domain-containing protein n=1 Tax=Linnemannia hyalina TaxID=64524 RepID=A0A9P7Y5N8_9FUNG|nr:hypothetical protein KI688_001190 [Linnemannia hyalina]